MKILIVTDLHGQRKCLNVLSKHLASNHYDGVFMCGDLCNNSDPKALNYAEEFYDIVFIKHRLPLYVVHGNQEPDVVKLFYLEKDISVHFNPKLLPFPFPTQGVGNEVVGVGYGDILPDDPSFAAGKILLTHEPPRAAVINKMILIGDLPHAPLIHFCGHLHQIAKIHKIGNTQLVQVPSLQSGRSATLELPTLEVKFINLK